MIQFYFDCSSPWTYLAFHNVQLLAVDLGVNIEWRPILVGGVFNAVNRSVYEFRDNPVKAKHAYFVKDLQDWAQHSGLSIRFPPSIFPVNSVKAMRGCIWVQRHYPDKFEHFARAVFEAYWGADDDISQDGTLSRICGRVGVDSKAFYEAIRQPEFKSALRANTEELIARGGFGSPTMFVGDNMYFGNDRLHFVRDAVARRMDTAPSR